MIYFFSFFQIIRTLIRFIPKLPQQAAFCLYNYIIGYIMFYVRHPKEKGQELIGQALATLWMVVHSVQGIMFKDLKQILRKEQVRYHLKFAQLLGYLHESLSSF